MSDLNSPEAAVAYVATAIHGEGDAAMRERMLTCFLDGIARFWRDAVARERADVLRLAGVVKALVKENQTLRDGAAPPDSTRKDH